MEGGALERFSGIALLWLRSTRAAWVVAWVVAGPQTAMTLRETL